MESTVEELRSELQRKMGTQELLKRLEHLEHTKAEVSEVDLCPCALWKAHLECISSCLCDDVAVGFRD
jgi:hypothetical protein